MEVVLFVLHFLFLISQVDCFCSHELREFVDVTVQLVDVTDVLEDARMLCSR